MSQSIVLAVEGARAIFGYVAQALVDERMCANKHAMKAARTDS